MFLILQKKKQNNISGGSHRNTARYRDLDDMSKAPLRISPRGPVVRFALYMDTVIAFILSCRAVTSCAFLSAEHEFYGNLAPGLFRTNNGNKNAACVHLNYNGELDLPPSFKAARTFAIMATLVGFTAVVLFSLVCMTERFNTRFFHKRVLPSLLVVASTLQLFTFSAFGLDNCHTFSQNGITFHGRCIFDQGANCSMAAFILYFLPVLPMVLYLPTPSHPLLVFSDAPGVSVEGTHRCLSKSDKQLTPGSGQQTEGPSKGGVVTDPPPAVDLDLPDQFDIVEIDDDMGEDVSALGNETISHLLMTHKADFGVGHLPRDSGDIASPPPEPADLLNTTGNTATSGSVDP